MYNLYCTGLVSKHAIGEANEEALSTLTSQKKLFLTFGYKIYQVYEVHPSLANLITTAFAVSRNFFINLVSTTQIQMKDHEVNN